MRGFRLKRPRILITRTRQQSSELAAAVERMGAEAILLPMIEVVPPKSFASLDEAIRLLARSSEVPGWVVFTSANAILALASHAKHLGLELHPRRIAVIGPATAKALDQTGIFPAHGPVILPPEYVAESLAATLLELCGVPENFLLVRAEEARDVIPDTLTAAGHRVQLAAAYRNQTPEGTLPKLTEMFATKDSYPDVISFTSSSTARNLITLLASIGKDIPPKTALASIGPITSTTLRDLGYEPTFEATEATIPSLANAIASCLATHT